MQWRTSCEDWAQRLKQGESIIPPPIFPDQAERALAIFKRLKIVDAPGSPTFGHACAPWVFDLVASIFGAYDATTGRRLITEWFVLIPKKNAKSTIAAGIMLTAVILNWRQSAEFAILAPTIEVAGNSFTPSHDMVRHDEALQELFQVQGHIKTLTHRATNATLKVVAADTNTVGGKKSVGTLVEELWIFGKNPKAEDILREAMGGLAACAEGFVVYLTTQSNEPPAGVFLQKLRYARDVRDGKIVDRNFVPIIFEPAPEVLEHPERITVDDLARVNPNLGYSVDRVFLERELRKAQQSGADALRGFLAKHGNVEVGLALRSDRWAGADFWLKPASEPLENLTFESVLERCEVVDVGIDGGGLDDLLGLAVLGRERDTRRWLLWTHAWAHPSVLARRQDIASRLRDFARDSDLTLVAHIGEDVSAVAAYVARIHALGLLDKVGVDPAGVGAVLDALDQAGIEKEQVIGISQGWRMSGAVKTTERKLAEGMLVHGGQRMMNWCVGNARVVLTGGGVNITKQASGTSKIDPLMAVFDAVTLMALNPAPKGRLDEFLNDPLMCGV